MPKKTKTNLLNKIKRILFSSLPAIILSTLLVVVMVYAWTEPPAGTIPPNNNVSAPLNVSNIGQTKAGGLWLNTSGSPIGLIVDKGNVGIGTTNPNFPGTTDKLLEISGAGEPGLKITNTGMTGSPNLFIGMNNGNNAAIFQVTNGKDFKFYNGQYAMTILGSNGNVGIGTTIPQAKLEVNGASRFSPLGSVPFTCDSTKAGSIYFANATKKFMMCNSTSWVEYIGPQGPAGATGATGPQGPQGPPGTTALPCYWNSKPYSAGAQCGSYTACPTAANQYPTISVYNCAANGQWVYWGTKICSTVARCGG